GFRSFANQVRSDLKASGASVNVELPAKPLPATRGPRRRPTEANLFSSIDAEEDAASAPPDNWEATYTLVDTPELWRGFLGQLRQQKRFAFDLETTSLDPLRSSIVGFAFSWKAGEGWYVPVLAPAEDKRLECDEVLKDLKPIFEDMAVCKINQNIK